MPKKRRGRPAPPVGVYVCTGCHDTRPTIRNGIHVECKCGAAPNRQLERLLDLPDWPRVIRQV